MRKLWRWLKAANVEARKRAEIVRAARGILEDLGEKPAEGVALLLMRLGLAHLHAVYQVQMAVQNRRRAGKAQMN